MDVIPSTDKQCTVQSKGYCAHADTITSLANRDLEVSAWRQEVRADLKEIKAATAGIELLRVEHNHHKEAMNRAFGRIESLETHRSEVTQFIARVQGMTALAWALWTILSGGLGLALFKLFQL